MVYSPWGPKELDMTDWLNNNNKASLPICRMGMTMGSEVKDVM